MTLTVQAVRENIKPRSCCIDLAIARSIQQDLGLIFSRTVSKLLLFFYKLAAGGILVLPAI